MDKGKSIFLLPFAGGSSLIYSKWKFEGLVPYPLEYSGHGFRFQEPMAQDMEAMVSDVVRQIEIRKPEEYFIFGHSMGGLVAWLTVQKLKRKPGALFISACEPPECLDVGRYGKYQDADILMRDLLTYKRVSERRGKSDVFRKMLLPVIRNDYRILSEYRYEPFPAIDIPVTVIYSREDTLMKYKNMETWKKYARTINFERVYGDHFYLEEEKERSRILRMINRVMEDG